MKNGMPRHPDGPRKAAWRILQSWEAGNEALEALRESYFKANNLGIRDRALVTELTQGTVRHLLFLDHTVQSNLDRPDHSLPGPVLLALRLGAYQLIHLHKIPAHASVMETVQIIKESRYRRFSPLVNAVLRKISDRGPAPLPSMEDSPIRHMELATSTPRWLVERLAGVCGLDGTRRILQALNRIPPITLRVNTARISREDLLLQLAGEGVAAGPGKLSETAIILEDRTAPWKIEAFREGLCTLQDEGAQIIAPLLEPAPGQRILDACAAPGGKTGHLAQLTGNLGFLVAADRNLKRTRMMVDSMERLGACNAKFLTAELGTGTSPFKKESFDGILLDAPCSGTGVLRRHPEGKWKKDPTTITRMTALQEDLLVWAGRMLKDGGRVLYTTCSLLEEENEKVVDRFLSASVEMRRIDMRKRFPDMRQDIFTTTGELRLWPHLHNCDGFFACLMEKGK